MNNPPKKPKNAYFLYKDQHYDELKKKHEKLSHKEIIAMLSENY